jgi:dihydropteroate synthase
MHRKFFHISELMADIHSQLIFDVGIGFGKTASQSWYILHNLWRVRNAGYQLMVGYSRKTLFRYYGVNTFKERDFYGMSLAKHLSDHNLVDFIRVHYTDSELQALTF